MIKMILIAISNIFKSLISGLFTLIARTVWSYTVDFTKNFFSDVEFFHTLCCVIKIPLKIFGGDNLKCSIISYKVAESNFCEKILAIPTVFFLDLTVIYIFRFQRVYLNYGILFCIVLVLFIFFSFFLSFFF